MEVNLLMDLNGLVEEGSPSVSRKESLELLNVASGLS